MATVITHAVAAAALSTFAPKAIPRIRLTIVLAVLAVIPDLDVIGFTYGISYSDALGHRGFTHSILFAAILGFVTPSIAFYRVQIFSTAWWVLVSFAFLATISHGVMDAFTNAGLGIGFFIPFDDSRYFAPWRPLATSPLSISAFINGPAIRILTNELIWVGLPLAGALVVFHIVRRMGSRGDV